MSHFEPPQGRSLKSFSQNLIMVGINPSQCFRTKEAEICQALNQKPDEGLTEGQTHPDPAFLFLSN